MKGAPEQLANDFSARREPRNQLYEVLAEKRSGDRFTADGTCIIVLIIYMIISSVKLFPVKTIVFFTDI